MSTQHLTTSYISDTIYLKIGNAEVALSQVLAKKLTKLLETKTSSTNCPKETKKYIYSHFSVDWKEIYSLPFTLTIETKVREF